MHPALCPSPDTAKNCKEPHTLAAQPARSPRPRRLQVLLGAPDGRVQIWNLRSGSLVHESSKFGKPGGAYASAVMAVEQSTALDVVGIGFANGRIALHNLKFDETVVTFSHEVCDHPP